MDLKTVGKTAVRAVTNNAPHILTGMGIAGVVATTVLAVRSTPMAIDILRDEEESFRSNSPEREFLGFTFKEKAQLTWKCYIPALSVGVVTIGCILGANMASSKKQAALLGLYSITDTAFREYKSKVVSTLGEEADSKVRAAVAQDTIEKNPPSGNQIFLTGKGEALYHDSLTGRYFKSDQETIRKAENDINYQINNEMYASQNEFYALIGLEATAYGEEIGWRSDHKLELEFSPMLATDGQPCVNVEYKTQPLREYYRNF